MDGLIKALKQNNKPVEVIVKNYFQEMHLTIASKEYIRTLSNENSRLFKDKYYWKRWVNKLALLLMASSLLNVILLFFIIFFRES